MMGSIGTHSGKFHCDEAFACFMLKCLPAFRDCNIIRSRDSQVLDKCKVVVDVGGIYDHGKLRYDHHQRGFTSTLKTVRNLEFYTKLSSAGLIFAHYGKDVIAHLLDIEKTHPSMDILYSKMYESFVEAIDAVDNGISQYDGPPRYQIGTTLSDRVGYLNPAWNDDPNINSDERFKDAINLVGQEFSDRLRYAFKSWLPARDIVKDAIEARHNVDKCGQILVISSGGVPWKDHFFQLEKELNLGSEKISYIVFQDNIDHQWRVQSIPLNETSTFENRIPLPEEWRGRRNGELSDISGIPGCIFVHINGFIGGNSTREGAVAMAVNSLQRTSKEVDSK
ncbi:hypothetical protein AB6A40_006819 [Gnathostoma spinigerum]|uniref:MYG1 protein n=1 Tax=Gnathostoma spinigerum TaxID=75299 RepID=A0ABD6EKN0_9BILA